MPRRRPVLAVAIALSPWIAAPSMPAHAQQSGVGEVAEAHLSILSPGVVLAVEQEGRLAFLDAWGRLRQHEPDTLSATSLFPLPGLTGFLVRATLLALEDAGQIDLDRPIFHLVPTLEPPLAEVTLRQLMTHTAGLDDARPREGWGWDRLLDDVDERWFFTGPGFVRSTSRYSWPLAGKVLETATGRPLGELLTAVLLEPVGMSRSTFDLERARALGLAPGFRTSNRPDTPVEEVEPAEEVDGMPVLFTTAPDLARLLAVWSEGGIRGTSPHDPPADSLPGAPRRQASVAGLSRQEYRGQVRVHGVRGGLGAGAAVEVLPDRALVVVAWSPGAPPVGVASFVLGRMADGMGLPLRARAMAGSDADAGVGAGRSDGDAPETRVVAAAGRSGIASLDVPGLAGTWVNGDRKIVLRAVDGGVALFDGSSHLAVEIQDGGRLVARLPDGRPVMPLYLVRDREGRPYLYQDTRAFRRAR